MTDKYDKLERADRSSRRVADHTTKWDALEPVEAVNGHVHALLVSFCESKRITLADLTALRARVAIGAGGAINIAYAGDNGAGAVVAIKYRPLGDTSHASRAETPSTWLRPLIVGRLDSVNWIVAEGETDAARLHGIVGDLCAILVLPAGAKTFRHEWAALIPRGATVALAHDADPQGDDGAAKAAKIIGGRTVRVRPPLEGGDWCDWPGDREAFLQLLAAAKGDGASGLTAVRFTEIGMRSIRWLEKPLWQASAFQLLAGQKGAGKGTYLTGLAARISKTGNVLFISSEDSAEIDQKPRLVAAGADMERCFLVDKHVRLPDNVDELRELAESLGGVQLLIIDPVANHIGSTRPNDDGEVRNAIAPLNALADDLSCLLIGVRHPGKDRTRGAVASILGSTAWVDVPRAVVMIAKDDQDDAVRHIQVVAGNRSLNGAGEAFRIEAVEVDGLEEPITKAVALGESAKSIEDLFNAQPKPESKSSAARELILDILDDEGAKESDTLDARVAKETDLSARTVRNLRNALVNEGLLRAFPDKDETGAIVRWNVSRTGAPRT